MRVSFPSRLVARAATPPAWWPTWVPLGSLRFRLTLWYTAVVGATLLVFGLALYLLLVRTLSAQADQATTTLAGQLAGEVRLRHVPPPGHLVVALPRADVFGTPDTFVQVADLRSGQVVARSTNLGDATLPFLPEALAAARRGAPATFTLEPVDQRLHVSSRPLRSGGRVVGVIEVGQALAAQERLLERLRLVLGLVAGLALPTAAVLGWLLADRALAPIGDFARAAAAIGRARDFSRRLTPVARAQDEVGHLAATVNGMLGELEAAHRDLAGAHARLEQALAAQRRFVADASHELRTPLTIIRANADVLQWAEAGDGDPAERALALADLAGEAERMSGLVDHLLTLARADAGQRLMLGPMAVRPLLEEAYRQARLLATGQAVVLQQADDATVLANPDALKQLLLILIENALKYTPAGGRVALALRAEGDTVRLVVADTGQGIAPEDLPRLFERFYRAEAVRAVSGSGLGLAIAQWIVQQHQGRIDVSSTPGRGSTVTVVLPITPPG